MYTSYKTNILPRQARDKHGESSTQKRGPCLLTSISAPSVFACPLQISNTLLLGLSVATPPTVLVAASSRWHDLH
jgi:hypothetical protein